MRRRRRVSRRVVFWFLEFNSGAGVNNRGSVSIGLGNFAVRGCYVFRSRDGWVWVYPGGFLYV